MTIGIGAGLSSGSSSLLGPPQLRRVRCRQDGKGGVVTRAGGRTKEALGGAAGAGSYTLDRREAISKAVAQTLRIELTHRDDGRRWGDAGLNRRRGAARASPSRRRSPPKRRGAERPGPAAGRPASPPSAGRGCRRGSALLDPARALDLRGLRGDRARPIREQIQRRRHGIAGGRWRA